MLAPSHLRMTVSGSGMIGHGALGGDYPVCHTGSASLERGWLSQFTVESSLTWTSVCGWCQSLGATDSNQAASLSARYWQAASASVKRRAVMSMADLIPEWTMPCHVYHCLFTARDTASEQIGRIKFSQLPEAHSIQHFDFSIPEREDALLSQACQHTVEMDRCHAAGFRQIALGQR